MRDWIVTAKVTCPMFETDAVQGQADLTGLLVNESQCLQSPRSRRLWLQTLVDLGVNNLAVGCQFHSEREGG